MQKEVQDLQGLLLWSTAPNTDIIADILKVLCSPTSKVFTMLITQAQKWWPGRRKSTVVSLQRWRISQLIPLVLHRRFQSLWTLTLPKMISYCSEGLISLKRILTSLRRTRFFASTTRALPRKTIMRLEAERQQKDHS